MNHGSTRHSRGYNSIVVSGREKVHHIGDAPTQIIDEKRFDVDIFESFLNKYESNMNNQKYELQSYKRTEDS